PVTATEETQPDRSSETPTVPADSRLGMSVDFNPDAATAKIVEPAAPSSAAARAMDVVPYFGGPLSEPLGGQTDAIPLDPEIENFDALRIKQQVAAELAFESPAANQTPSSSSTAANK